MALDLCMILWYCLLVGFALLCSLCVAVYLTSTPYATVHRSTEEKYFLDPVSGEKHLFPSLNDLPTINLSIVVPAYNEESRLPPMLDECVEFLQQRHSGFKYEIIIVSDGSTDKTVSVATEYSKKFGANVIRVLPLVRNRGKGGAVRLGVQSSRGAVILFADADGATKFSDLSKLEASLHELTGADYMVNKEEVALRRAIVCGSRAHLEEQAIATRSYFRTVLMYGFHFLVWLFAVRSLKDTQCGFKLLTREAASVCFESMHVERWAFDVELLYIAEKLNIALAEISVNWTEIEGSKVVPVWSWLQMGRDLFLIWFRYRIGAWKLVKEHN